MIFEDKTFVLGIGAPKAGTTWLYKYLSEHEEVYIPRGKESHYFDTKYRLKTCYALAEAPLTVAGERILPKQIRRGPSGPMVQ